MRELKIKKALVYTNAKGELNLVDVNASTTSAYIYNVDGKEFCVLKNDIKMVDNLPYVILKNGMLKKIPDEAKRVDVYAWSFTNKEGRDIKITIEKTQTRLSDCVFDGDRVIGILKK